MHLVLLVYSSRFVQLFPPFYCWRIVGELLQCRWNIVLLEYRCAGISLEYNWVYRIPLISLDITGILPRCSPIPLTTHLTIRHNPSQSVTIRHNPSYNSYDKELDERTYDQGVVPVGGSRRVVVAGSFDVQLNAIGRRLFFDPSSNVLPYSVGTTGSHTGSYPRSIQLGVFCTCCVHGVLCT